MKEDNNERPEQIRLKVRAAHYTLSDCVPEQMTKGEYRGRWACEYAEYVEHSDSFQDLQAQGSFCVFSNT